MRPQTISCAFSSLPCFVLFVALDERVFCPKTIISECIAGCVVFTNSAVD